ncbi:MAG: hypothetical protein HY816_09950 [Candidatus Wallbacteria bacterium]|nr:hypothetical protein [Candidatus Wallbacteria bacterium]
MRPPFVRRPTGSRAARPRPAGSLPAWALFLRGMSSLGSRCELLLTGVRVLDAWLGRGVTAGESHLAESASAELQHPRDSGPHRSDSEAKSEGMLELRWTGPDDERLLAGALREICERPAALGSPGFDPASLRRDAGSGQWLVDVGGSTLALVIRGADPVSPESVDLTLAQLPDTRVRAVSRETLAAEALACALKEHAPEEASPHLACASRLARALPLDGASLGHALELAFRREPLPSPAFLAALIESSAPRADTALLLDLFRLPLTRLDAGLPLAMAWPAGGPWRFTGHWRFG